MPVELDPAHRADQRVSDVCGSRPPRMILCLCVWSPTRSIGGLPPYGLIRPDLRMSGTAWPFGAPRSSTDQILGRAAQTGREHRDQLHRVRRAADRRHATPTRTGHARLRLRAAVALVGWLGKRGIRLASVRQPTLTDGCSSDPRCCVTRSGVAPMRRPVRRRASWRAVKERVTRGEVPAGSRSASRCCAASADDRSRYTSLG